MKLKSLKDLPAYKVGTIFTKKDDEWWFNGAPLMKDSWISILLDIHSRYDVNTAWFKNVTSE